MGDWAFGRFAPEVHAGLKSNATMILSMDPDRRARSGGANAKLERGHTASFLEKQGLIEFQHKSIATYP
jgi:hypothetical protein